MASTPIPSRSTAFFHLGSIQRLPLLHPSTSIAVPATFIGRIGRGCCGCRPRRSLSVRSVASEREVEDSVTPGGKCSIRSSILLELDISFVGSVHLYTLSLWIFVDLSLCFICENHWRNVWNAEAISLFLKFTNGHLAWLISRIRCLCSRANSCHTRLIFLYCPVSYYLNRSSLIYFVSFLSELSPSPFIKVN